MSKASERRREIPTNVKVKMNEDALELAEEWLQENGNKHSFIESLELWVKRTRGDAVLRCDVETLIKNTVFLDRLTQEGDPHMQLRFPEGSGF